MCACKYGEAAFAFLTRGKRRVSCADHAWLDDLEPADLATLSSRGAEPRFLFRSPRGD